MKRKKSSSAIAAQHLTKTVEGEIEKQAEVLLEEVLALITPIVKKIEASPPLTKNHYNTYMAVLSQAPDPKERLKLGAILLQSRCKS